MNVSDEKQRLRRQVLATRRSIPTEQREQWSAQIALRIIHLLEQLMPDRLITILSYMALSDEVSMDGLHDWCRQAGHALWLPRVADADAGRLDLVAATEQTSFTLNRWGIREPVGMALPAEGTESVDVLLIPGVAYDERGVRLGFGGGFYDRLCARIRCDAIMAPAFDCQLVERVPAAPHDCNVHYIVTNTRLVETTENR